MNKLTIFIFLSFLLIGPSVHIARAETTVGAGGVIAEPLDRTKPSCDKGDPWNDKVKTCKAGAGKPCKPDKDGPVGCTPYKVTCLYCSTILGQEVCKRKDAFEGCGCNSDEGALAVCPKEDGKRRDCELSGWDGKSEPPKWEPPQKCKDLPTPVPVETF